MAREKGWLLGWDEFRKIVLLNPDGSRQAHASLDDVPSAACCADDGSCLAVGSKEGHVWLLNRDLTIDWHHKLPERVLALAVDSFGNYIAVSDLRHGLHVFDRQGKIVQKLESPRAFHHLVFVPAEPYLIGSSDFGLVACLDLAGKWVWRDGLVIHVGGLSVSGSGEVIAFACYTEGIHRYRLSGKTMERFSVGEACRLVSVSFDGKSILTAGMANRLTLLDATGQSILTHDLDEPAKAMVLSPLGDEVFVALEGGRMVGLKVTEGST